VAVNAAAQIEGETVSQFARRAMLARAEVVAARKDPPVSWLARQFLAELDASGGREIFEVVFDRLDERGCNRSRVFSAYHELKLLGLVRDSGQYVERRS
jgi:hypothetical protein